MKTVRNLVVLVAALAAATTSFDAAAQLRVGFESSATGPGASLGVPEKNTMALLPKTIAGLAVTYIYYDEATDPTQAVLNERKMIAQDKVDVIIGASITPAAIAMTPIAAEAHVPFIAMSASSSITSPVEGDKKWVFKTPQDNIVMASAVADFFAKKGVKTVGFIGFADSYGQGWWDDFSAQAKTHGIEIVADERYARLDTSVTGQILRILAKNPDAVLIAGGGTPAALPQKELRARNYKGMTMQTHASANRDFLRVCGADCEGAFLPAGPLLVAEQLPDSNPAKGSALTYKKAYEAAYGPSSVSTFGGHAWDAGLLLETAVPVALKAGQPGTEAFRGALRSALENIHELPGSQGIIDTTPTNHGGMDARARVIVEIKNNDWTLAPGQ
jgi:branched-chain amino acid transport system substrate-binding protein